MGFTACRAAWGSRSLMHRSTRAMSCTGRFMPARIRPMAYVRPRAEAYGAIITPSLTAPAIFSVWCPRVPMTMGNGRAAEIETAMMAGEYCAVIVNGAVVPQLSHDSDGLPNGDGRAGARNAHSRKATASRPKAEHGTAVRDFVKCRHGGCRQARDDGHTDRSHMVRASDTGVQRHCSQADVDIPIKLFVRIPEEVIALGLSQLCQGYERARGMFTEDQQARFHGHQTPCRIMWRVPGLKAVFDALAADVDEQQNPEHHFEDIGENKAGILFHDRLAARLV